MWILTAHACKLAKSLDVATIYRLLRSRNLTLICTRMEEKEKTEHGNPSRVPIKRDSRMIYDSARSHQVTVTCCLPKQALPIDTTRSCWRSHRQSGNLGWIAAIYRYPIRVSCRFQHKPVSCELTSLCHYKKKGEKKERKKKTFIMHYFLKK